MSLLLAEEIGRQRAHPINRKRCGLGDDPVLVRLRLRGAETVSGSTACPLVSPSGRWSPSLGSTPPREEANRRLERRGKAVHLSLRGPGGRAHTGGLPQGRVASTELLLPLLPLPSRHPARVKPLAFLLCAGHRGGSGLAPRALGFCLHPPLPPCVS